MDAVIMARVSSKEQEEGLSLDAQSARLTEYAMRKGMNVVKTFVLTESSVHGKRRGFYSVIKYLKQTTRPTALIADAVDRVQRTFSEIGMLDALRKDKKIELHFYRENLIIDNSSTSQDIMRWEFSVLAAHSYVLALSENVKRSINHKLANGEISGHAPFGYRNIRTPAGTGDIIPNPDTAPYVRKMFEIYAQGDRTYKDMAKMMNDWGMRIGRAGRKFDPAKVMLMLCNRFYYGEYERNGKIHKLRYEPIISKELWQRTEAVRLGRSYYTPHERRISTPFRGVLKCANTGRLCQIEEHRGKMYITGYTPDGRRKYVPVENIEAQVVQILDTIRPSQEAMDFVTDALKGTKKAEANWRESETRRINLEICENSRRIDALVDMYIDKKIDQDVYQTKLEQLKARGEELQKSLEINVEANDEFNATVVNLVNLAHGAGHIFRECSNVALKTQLLKLVFRTLNLDGISIGYQLNFPFSEMQQIPDISRWGG